MHNDLHYISIPNRGWNVLTRSLHEAERTLEGVKLGQRDVLIKDVIFSSDFVYRKEGNRFHIAHASEVPNTEGEVFNAKLKSIYGDNLYVLDFSPHSVLLYDGSEGIIAERSLHSDGTFRHMNKMHSKDMFVPAMYR